MDSLLTVSPGRADESTSRRRRTGQPLKILHVGKFMPPSFGGMERALHAMATGMADRGHAVRVLAHADGGAPEISDEAGVRVMRAPYALRFGTMPLSLTYLDTYRRWSRWADIVHFHEPFPPASIGFCLLPTPPRVVVSWHSDIVRQRLLRPIAQFFQSRLCAHASRIISSTAQLRDRSPMLARWRDKCAVIGFGLDTAPFQRACSDRAGIEAWRRRYGGRFALAVGRLVSYKGFDVLLQALAATDARLVIVGEGPLDADLRRQCAALGLADRVVFAGGVADRDLPGHYAACEFLVLPSVSAAETFGIVQIEAMACGKPVINTDLPTGVPEVSLDGVTGITVPPGDADALATALDRLWHDPSLTAALGERARARVETCYAREATAVALESLYRAVMRARPSAASPSINEMPIPISESATIV